MSTKLKEGVLENLYWGKTRSSGFGASLVAQWLRIRLPMQGTRVQALVREDPTFHNYWAWALEPTSHNYWAHVTQLLEPACLEPVLHNKRSYHNEKPAHRNEEWPPLTATREKPARSNEDPTQPKINLKKKNLVSRAVCIVNDLPILFFFFLTFPFLIIKHGYSYIPYFLCLLNIICFLN